MTTITTQRELAAMLGVSAVAVSRALRGKEGVGDKLRRRIQQAAAKHGLLDALPTARSQLEQLGTVAVLMQLTNAAGHRLRPVPFNATLLSGIQEALSARGCEAVICDLRGDDWPGLIRRGEVDGVIASTPHTEIAGPVGHAPVPLVCCFLPRRGADLVSVDDFEAGELLGTHLGELGHRRVAFIGPRQGMAVRRAAGLAAGLEAFGGTVPVENRLLSHWRSDGSVAAEQMAKLWERSGGTVDGLRRICTAIVGYNDAAAAHIRAFLLARRIRIPEDISLGGVDGVTPPGFEDYGLTTVDLPLATVGAEAVNLVYWRRETPRAPRRNLVFRPALRVGTTTGPTGTT